MPHLSICTSAVPNTASIAPQGRNAMAELIVSTPIASAQHNNGSVFQAFDDYGWDRDKNFLGGLVLALGGYHALAQSASQADLVLHSRIFYYARITGGVTIPYSLYRGWLRHQCLASHEPPRLWEWHLLELMCSHRDRVCGTNTSDESTHTAAAEKALWIKDLLKDDDRAVPGLAAPDNIESHGTGHLTTAAPAWMAAAPREELYVHRRNAADGHGSDDLVPYPDKFGVIIRAIQTGEKIEGIVEIPDIVARNPTTLPTGTMKRPPKPWERVLPISDMNLEESESVLGSHLDHAFPGKENEDDGQRPA